MACATTDSATVYGVGSIEVSKEHISSSAPTRRVQVQGQNMAAEEDVKALQARVATIEKQVPKVRVLWLCLPLHSPSLSFATLPAGLSFGLSSVSFPASSLRRLSAFRSPW